MKVKFENPPKNYHLTITPENKEEALELIRWDNCIVAAHFLPDYSGSASGSTLHLIKEEKS